MSFGTENIENEDNLNNLKRSSLKINNNNNKIILEEKSIQNDIQRNIQLMKGAYSERYSYKNYGNFTFHVESMNEIKTGRLSNDGNQNVCLICFDNKPDSVFMDCGHGGKLTF